MRDPIVAQLTQGLTPRKIALTIAIGGVIAVFPILGTTTLLCVAAGIVFKLNQPILQAMNVAGTPVHLPFIYFAVRCGEWLFGSAETPLDLPRMKELLLAEPLTFLREFGQAAVQAIAVWCLLAPLAIALIYAITLPILRDIDRVRLENLAQAAAEKARDHPLP